MNEKVDLKLEVWDIGGSERFTPQFQKNYHNKIDLYLIVYDITSRQSFENISERVTQIEMFKDYPIVVLIGNKSDLEDDREVTYQEGKDCAEEYGLAFFETSALDGSNVFEVFENIIIAKYLFIIEASFQINWVAHNEVEPKKGIFPKCMSFSK